jgi:uncharacterized membrane protein YgcG
MITLPARSFALFALLLWAHLSPVLTTTTNDSDNVALATTEDDEFALMERSYSHSRDDEIDSDEWWQEVSGEGDKQTLEKRRGGGGRGGGSSGGGRSGGGRSGGSSSGGRSSRSGFPSSPSFSKSPSADSKQIPIRNPVKPPSVAVWALQNRGTGS